MRFGEAIPGAYILADIAAKHPVVKLSLVRFRKLFLQFDREIGDAFTAINFVRFYDGISRAGIDAGGTASAVIGHRGVIFQLKIYNELCDKIERTDLFG